MRFPVLSSHQTLGHCRRLRKFVSLGHWTRAVVAGVAALLLAPSALADPFAEPGDLMLRHDLEFLADHRLISTPVTTWPMSWVDITIAINSVSLPDNAPISVRRVVKRVENAVANSTRWGVVDSYMEFSAADNRDRLRTFDDTPRGTATVTGVVEYSGNSFASKIRVSALANTDDDQNLRLDGSYVGFVWKNTAFTLGAQDRWWGPGQLGSIILSNNARPVPGLQVQRKSAVRFSSRWLRWLGPWTATGFVGRLESSRDFANPYLLGARVVIKPLPSLELGVSRTAQWGGEGRPESIDSLFNLIIGRDNQGEGVTREEEPGNQLAGFDARYSAMVFGQPLTAYAQLIGEDEAGGFPSRYLGQLGMATSFAVPWREGTVRLVAEYSDTTCQFHESSRLYNCAYNNSIYRTGYRYRGRALGHSTDNDTAQVAVGATLVTADKQLMSVLLRQSRINRAGGFDPAHTLTPTGEDSLDIDLKYERPFWGGKLEVGVGWNSVDERLSGQDRSEVRMFAGWRGSSY